MVIPIDTLDKFLSQYKLSKESSELYTHTKLSGGKYKVPIEGKERFLELYYKDVFELEKDISLTEANSKITQLKVDIDFKYADINTLDHVYDINDIFEIIKIYIKAIDMHLHVADLNKECFILEKKAACIDPKGKTDPKTGLNIYKDGVHLMFPKIVTHAKIAHKIREYVLDNIGPVLEKYKFINSIDAIVDESVIERNNWFVYGAKKPNSLAYAVSYYLKYEITEDTIVLHHKPIDTFTNMEYIKMFSILDKDSLPWKNAVRSEYSSLLELDGVLIKSDYMKFKEESRKKNKKASKKSDEELDLIYKIIDLLSTERASDDHYSDWISLGWCLHNIHNYDDRLLQKWIEFSKTAPQYYNTAEKECRERWSNFKDGGLGIGTLIHWAKIDNKELYFKLQEENITSIMRSNISKNKLEHNDVGKIFHKRYRHQYIAVCVKNAKYAWYEFINHRWTSLGSHSKIRKNLSDDLSVLFNKQNEHFAVLANNKGADDPNYNQLLEFASRSLKVSQKLRQGAFKNAVITECQDEFVDEAKNFIDKMNESTFLVGCNNGIYDLNKMEFRDGRPDDLITFSNKIDYDSSYTWNDQKVKDIMIFIKQVLPNDNVRQYVLNVLASCLDGSTKREKFYILTGTGGNGKSKLIELLDLALGDYSKGVSVALLTKKRADSNAAQPELAITKGCRVIKFQEAEENSKLNTGLLKELTGGDKITCRGLFQDPIEFKPQFTPFFICNDKPELPAHDDGTWRRVRIIDFPSRFMPIELNPNPLLNQYPIDYELSEKIKDWAEAFLWILIETYKECKKNGGFSEPKEVLEYTDAYRKKNDIFNSFLNECMIVEMSALFYLNDAFRIYKDWHKENYAGTSQKPEKKDKLREYLTKRLGKEYDPTQSTHKPANYKQNGTCWLGYKLSSIDNSNSPMKPSGFIVDVDELDAKN